MGICYHVADLLDKERLYVTGTLLRSEEKSMMEGGGGGVALVSISGRIG